MILQTKSEKAFLFPPCYVFWSLTLGEISCVYHEDIQTDYGEAHLARILSPGKIQKGTEASYR